MPPLLLLPPQIECIKENFDVAIRDNFAVAATVINDFSGNITLAGRQKLHFTYVLLGETTTALLASRLASTTGRSCFALEGDALLVILAMNQPHFFSWSLFISKRF